MKPLAIVTGAYQGLGALIAKELELQFYEVVRWDLRFEQSVDVADWQSVKRAADRLEWDDQVSVLVNCAGVNHIATIPDIDPETFDAHMAVNARGMLYTVQALLPKLEGGTVCNVVSNASHMPMRQSLCYNASKAAAAMITRQMARELGKPHDLTVFGVSPNRLRGTPMSDSIDKQVATARGWSLEKTRQKQLEALPIGEETDPAAVAEFIGFLLSTKQRHRFLHGAIMEYGI